MERAGTDKDPEPRFAWLEELLGRKFGWLDPRDVFDPAVDRVQLEEGNRRAVENLRSWWAGSSPHLWYDAARSLWTVNEEARKAGRPVDPKTGEPLP